VIRIVDHHEIAPILGDLRILNRLSQRALAAESGYRQAQICLWLQGRTVPNVETLIRLANVFGYDLALVPQENAA